MEKKIYQTPSMEVMQVESNCTLLAGSTKVEISDGEEINNGYVDARQSPSFSLWDSND